MRLFFAICFLLPVIAWSFVRDMHLPSLVRLKAGNTQLSAFNGRTLTVPQHINAKMFAQVGINHTHVPPVGKFRLDATIPAAVMQKNLDDYIQEAMRQTKGRALYNGWRNGVIPPYAMKDIVNVLVSFLLEPMIGELCHANNLELCGENKEAAKMKDVTYMDKIMVPDKKGKTYEQQRERWVTGTDYRLFAEFHAIMHEGVRTS